MSQTIQDELEARRKLRKLESQTPLSTDEVRTAKAFIELLRKPVALEKISSVMHIPSWRMHQIYQSLRSDTNIEWHYVKDEWFAKYKFTEESIKT